MENGRTFDKVAALYDAHRNGYPEKLFADLSALAAVGTGDRVLEVGCGSGQATTGLAGQGFDVTAIDPGPALVEIARQKLANSPNVRFAVASFEEWPLGGPSFHLVAAAQSWHWIRPEIGFEKAAKALMPGGHLAIFGHTPLWSAELTDRLEPVYLRLAPELRAPPPENWYLPAGPIPGLFAASGKFESAEHRAYAWRRRYSPASFAAYLATRSDHNGLPADRRNNLLAAVEASLPPEVDADWVTNLYVAAVRKS